MNYKKFPVGLEPFLRKLSFSLLLLLLSTTVSAVNEADDGGDDHSHGGGDHSHCRHALGEDVPRPFEFFGSGQDAAVREEHYGMAYHIYEEVCRDLGFNIPPHVIRALSATDMAALSSAGGHPTPTWMDGLEVLRSTFSAAGIYEFVTPGSPVHQQFVRDTNSPHEMLLVLAHVGGHYDFAVNTPYFATRNADQMRYSYELATYMLDLFRTENKADVQLFYQRLLTIKYLQDLTRGSYDPGETPLSRPTQGILQALVANPPAGWTPWQKRMAELFEHNHRALPAYVQTKVMNEGWATIVEYIILAHSKYNSSADGVKLGIINAGVRVPKLSNPYWLGTEAWMRLRARFQERPEIAALHASPKEQDRRFIAYAHEIIRTHSDYTFLRLALDESWIRSHGLILQRNINQAELQDLHRRGIWNGQQPVPNRIAITREPERVVANIAHRIANRDFHFPTVELRSFNDHYLGRILMKHVPLMGIPLKRTTMVKSLYEMAHVFERPVTLETIASTTWFPEKRMQPGQPGWYWTPPRPATPYVFPIKVTVDPQGKVTVEAENHLLSPAEKADLTARFDRVVRRHRFDTALTYPEQTQLAERAGEAQYNPDIFHDILNIVQMQSSPSSIDRMIRLHPHAPTSTAAIRAYHEAAARRVYEYLRLMAQGKMPVNMNGQTIQIQAFNPIPHLELDNNLAQRRNGYLPVTPPDSPVFGSQQGSAFFQRERIETHGRQPINVPATAAAAGTPQQLAFMDLPNANQTTAATSPEAASGTQPTAFPIDPLNDEDLVLGGGDRVPGSIWHEDEEPGEGEGEGDGEDEEDSEEADDGDPTKPAKPKPGKKPRPGQKGDDPDPSVISIPIEVYGKILAEQIELRNLRRTRGENPQMDEMHEDSVRRPTGQILHTRTAMNAAALGLGLQKPGTKVQGMRGFMRLLRNGWRHLTPDRHVVRDWAPQPVPDMDAVMVWVRDTSGSMGADRVKVVSNYVANTRAVLKSVYPSLKERFVIYSSTAFEVSEEDFFNKAINGGTDTTQGVQQAAKILEEYPYEEFNRFVSMFSDGDDFSGGAVLEEVRKLLPTLEHFAYGHIDGDMPREGTLSQMSQGFDEMNKRNPLRVGFARMNHEFISIIQALRKFYGKQ